MENLEVIISLAGTAAGLLVTALTFIIKLIKSIRQRIKEEGACTLLNAVAPIVEIAESFVHFTGAEKKEYVLTKANQFAIEHNIDFNAAAVSDKIEQLVELSKTVNKRTAA